MHPAHPWCAPPSQPSPASGGRSRSGLRGVGRSDQRGMSRSGLRGMGRRDLRGMGRRGPSARFCSLPRLRGRAGVGAFFGQPRRGILAPIPTFPRRRGKEQERPAGSGQERPAGNRQARRSALLCSLPRLRGRAGVGALFGQPRRGVLAPIPTFPRRRGKEQERPAGSGQERPAGNRQARRSALLCSLPRLRGRAGVGALFGQPRRGVLAPIPTFPRKRGKEQERPARNEQERPAGE